MTGPACPASRDSIIPKDAKTKIEAPLRRVRKAAQAIERRRARDGWLASRRAVCKETPKRS